MSDESQHKNTWPCPGDPKALLGQPIGMYHCEYCGEMQIAGMDHLPPQFPEQWTGEFPKIENDGPELPSELPSVADLYGLLKLSSRRKDVELTRCHLRLLLDHDPVDTKHVWETYHKNREDEHVAFILEHINLDKDDDDNWIVSMKGEF